MAKKSTSTTPAPAASTTDKRPKPEHSINGLPGGIGFALWKNRGPDGRLYRTWTMQTRRYKDKDSGEWKDGPMSDKDFEIVKMAMNELQRYCQDHPLDGDDPQPPSFEDNGGGETPF